MGKILIPNSIDNIYSISSYTIESDYTYEGLYIFKYGFMKYAYIDGFKDGMIENKKLTVIGNILKYPELEPVTSSVCHNAVDMTGALYRVFIDPISKGGSIKVYNYSGIAAGNSVITFLYF